MMSTIDKHLLLLKYVKNIPKDLLSIFIPKTEKGLAQLEANLLAKTLDRPHKLAAKKLRAQYQNDLPLSARRYTLRRLKIAIKIIELRKRLADRWKDDNG